MAKIKNMKVPVEQPCRCGSGMKHWENYSGQTLACCVEINCTGKDLVGTLVQKANVIDDAWYVIPLCQTHSVATEELEISDNYRLVPADPTATCESVRRSFSSLPQLPLSGSPRSY